MENFLKQVDLYLGILLSIFYLILTIYCPAGKCVIMYVHRHDRVALFIIIIVLVYVLICRWQNVLSCLSLLALSIVLIIGSVQLPYQNNCVFTIIIMLHNGCHLKS